MTSNLGESRSLPELLRETLALAEKLGAGHVKRAIGKPTGVSIADINALVPLRERIEDALSRGAARSGPDDCNCGAVPYAHHHTGMGGAARSGEPSDELEPLLGLVEGLLKLWADRVNWFGPQPEAGAVQVCADELRTQIERAKKLRAREPRDREPPQERGAGVLSEQHRSQRLKPQASNAPEPPPRCGAITSDPDPIGPWVCALPAGHDGAHGRRWEPPPEGLAMLAQRWEELAAMWPNDAARQNIYRLCAQELRATLSAPRQSERQRCPFCDKLLDGGNCGDGTDTCN